MISNEEIYEDSMIGRRVGVYEIKREIGRGGMGTVYLAERVDGEFRQTVAIKLIKRGMDTDLVLKRFRRERQIIAALEHPNIAYFLAGGSTETGLPYFVMEYIDGQTLYDFCAENKLNLDQRLKIFGQICDAVEVAHKNKVIHRDLKPSNILVKKDGTPKLLDFGIAKVLDPELAVTDIDPTSTSMRAMTPEYASPEQVTGREITPVSDVYSLGIILYELLTGRRPYQLKRLASHEIARIISEEEPLRPSRPNPDAEMLIAGLRYVSQNGRAEIEKLSFEVQPSKLEQLDRIVLKALRKNPAERYQSVAALAEDVTNYLENRPVNAEVFLPEAIIRQRNVDRRSVAILPFKFISEEQAQTTDDIFLGIGLTDVLISRLSGIQRLVLRPTGTILRFSERNDPLEVGRQLSVDFVLDGSIRYAGGHFQVTAQMLQVENDSTLWSASFEKNPADILELEDILSEMIAESLLPNLSGEEKKQISKRATNNPAAFNSYLRGRINWNLQTEEGFSRAIDFYRQAVEFDPEYALAFAAIAEYYIFLGIHCLIPFHEGSLAAKKAAEKAVRLDPSLAEGHAALGFVSLTFDLDWKKALDRISHAVEINQNSHQAHFWRTAILTQTGQFDKALGELARLKELDPDSLLNLHMQAWVFYHARRFDESIGVHRKLLKIEPNYTFGLQTYSWALREVGEFEEAITQAERAVQLTGQSPFYLTNLAATYAKAGDHPKAEEILVRILEIGKTRFVSEYTLALVYCARGDKDQAFENLEKSLVNRDSWLNWLGVDPQFGILRQDPRYDELLRRTGNPLAKTEGTKLRVSKKQTDNKSTGKKSIAVLPLQVSPVKNPDFGGEDSFLGIGLADALTTRLSHVQRLILRPTSSILQFSDLSPLEAGQNADVDFILSGSIRRAGERIRITVQLLNVAEGSAVWAENFDEKYTDVLELEDSISERVTKSLLPRLTGEERRQLEKRGTNSHEAYEAYLRARFYWTQFTPESFMKAIAGLEQAVAIDPNYALAYCAIAEVYHWAAIYGIFPTPEAAPRVFAAASRALEIDPSLGEAHIGLGMYYSCQFDYERSVESYRRAIELAPNYSLGRVLNGSNLVGIGRFDEGLKELEIAERLDPVSPLVKTLSAWAYYQSRRFETAYQMGKEIIALDPNYAQGWLQIGNPALELGLIKEALEACEKAIEMLKPLPIYQYCFALVANGQTEMARESVRSLVEKSKTEYVMPHFLGMVHVAIGEIDEAFNYFEKSLAEKNHWLLWFGTEAKLDPIRTDERYFKLFERMKNPLFEKEKTRIKSDPPRKSIAVLPFKIFAARNTENSQEDEFLSLGLADALTTRLSGVKHFLMRPTSAVMRFADHADAFQAGTELGVDFVIEGNVRRAGERIRITTQLLDVRAQTARWADKFDELFTDVLELEDSLSENVVQSLLPKLTGEERKSLEKRGTDSHEAYEAYLRGRAYWNLQTEDGFSRSINFYRQAVAHDPEYAQAWVAIAEYYIFLGIHCVIPYSESATPMREAAEKAVRYDPTLAEGYATLGFVAGAYQYDWKKAEELFQKSLELNPNSLMANFWYASLLAQTGRFEDSMELIGKILESDPNSLLAIHLRAWILYHAREFTQSVEIYRKMLSVEPNYAWGIQSFSWALRKIGRFDEAIEYAAKALRLSGRNPLYLITLAAAYADMGDSDRVFDILVELNEIGKTEYVSEYMLAYVYSALGDKDKAFEKLEKSIAVRDDWMRWFGIDPQFDVLRDDPRYQELLRLTGNPLADEQNQDSQP